MRAVSLLTMSLLLLTTSAVPAATPVDAFASLKSLAGEWVDADGSLGEKGKVVVTFKVTAGGSAVVETLFPGSPDHEMVSVYTVEGSDVVMSHYCAMGNQPRMRATKFDGKRLPLAFDGGLNIDPARDMHMHEGFVEFVDADHVRTQWQTFVDGKPGEHLARFNLQRKAAATAP